MREHPLPEMVAEIVAARIGRDERPHLEILIFSRRWSVRDLLDHGDEAGRLALLGPRGIALATTTCAGGASVV